VNVHTLETGIFSKLKNYSILEKSNKRIILGQICNLSAGMKTTSYSAVDVMINII